MTSFFIICYLRNLILRLNTYVGLLIKNIKGLVQAKEIPGLKVCGKDMAVLNNLTDSYLFIEGEFISGFGPMEDLHNVPGLENQENNRVIDASGKFVFPSFCDSHTHLVYAGSRENEFKDKISGFSYEEIAKRGGGILNSARKLMESSEDDIFNQSMVRVREITGMGTGAVEIKSGYGLSLEGELKMLRVIRRIRENSPLEVRATFLGAHSVPGEFRGRKTDYVDLVINEMIPVIASEQLADYIDVFCDNGFFSTEDTERILMAGLKYGLTPKIHANQFGYSGGIQTGIKYNALSVDHLEHTGDADIEDLKASDTMPTILPGSSFFLGVPDAPARKMIDAGLPVALASDYNPGSSPSGNMKLVISLACIRLKMLPEEAINAATINSAYAMGISETHGSIARGKIANIFITKEMPSYGFLPYSFGSDLVDTIILRGRVIE